MGGVQSRVAPTGERRNAGEAFRIGEISGNKGTIFHPLLSWSEALPVSSFSRFPAGLAPGMCHLLEAARRHVAKVALGGCQARVPQLFGGSQRMSPTLFFPPGDTRCLWSCCPRLPSLGRRGATGAAASGRAPCDRPGPLLCLSRNLYKSKAMFSFKLTKAENGAREAL